MRVKELLERKLIVLEKEEIVENMKLTTYKQVEVKKEDKEKKEESKICREFTFGKLMPIEKSTTSYIEYEDTTVTEDVVAEAAVVYIYNEPVVEEVEYVECDLEVNEYLAFAMDINKRMTRDLAKEKRKMELERQRRKREAKAKKRIVIRIPHTKIKVKIKL